ncbi:nucleotidyltransferase domain-containing protein [Candidatus Woesearchaeota archaeon]|nr:nucleotidyltransferase domain-containing protein [Candidatus Woesearchaeota archaeon]
MALKNINFIPKQFHPDLEAFTEICRQKLGRNLVSIILFGSIARGTPHQWSDFDFCVVTKETQEQDKFKIMRQFKPNCDVLFRREKDLPKYLQNLSGIDFNIFNEGIVIYGEDSLRKNRTVYEKVKQKYHLIYRQQFGKGVWEIGTAS